VCPEIWERSIEPSLARFLAYIARKGTRFVKITCFSSVVGFLIGRSPARKWAATLPKPWILPLDEFRSALLSYSRPFSNALCFRAEATDWASHPAVTRFEQGKLKNRNCKIVKNVRANVPRIQQVLSETFCCIRFGRFKLSMIDPTGPRGPLQNDLKVARSRRL
jgi:hypothetical protein